MDSVKVIRDKERKDNFAIYKTENFLNLAMNCLLKQVKILQLT